MKTQEILKNSLNKRKHVKHMDNSEQQILLGKLEEITLNRNWTITDYALKRLSERGIYAKYDEIIYTVFDCELLEYHVSDRNGGEERVLVRSNHVVKGCYNMHIVYGITTNEVVTIWLNHVNDRHDTLDWSLYDSSLKIIK